MIQSPLPTLRHTLSLSHPDVLAGLSIDEAWARAQARGDEARDVKLPLRTVSAVREWLMKRSVMILQPDTQLSCNGDRWIVLFTDPRETSDFASWLDTQAVLAKLMGQTDDSLIVP